VVEGTGLSMNGLKEKESAFDASQCVQEYSCISDIVRTVTHAKPDVDPEVIITIFYFLFSSDDNNKF
jgi:hypothetical protein